jgi:hypothetical protein
MLFLGFDRLQVNVPAQFFDYQTSNVVMHDRLTVIDTTNTVTWYIMRDALDNSGDLQCPEWSTHYDYLACLVGHIGKSYSGYAVRFSDREVLKLCDNVMEEFSTPHFWLPATAGNGVSLTNLSFKENGFIEKEHITSYFGTEEFKYVYTLPAQNGTLFFVDYTSNDAPQPRPLTKPQGRENWYCASPIISPDGGWIAFHCFTNATKGPLYSSYIQQLHPGSHPVLIAEGASDPHWWVDSTTGSYHIIYTKTFNDYFTEYDFTDTTIETRLLSGCTLRQPLIGNENEQSLENPSLMVDNTSEPDTLIRLPFKGGLSHDGRFLSTAYKYAYITKLDEKR